jgi:hypothetical protein
VTEPTDDLEYVAQGAAKRTADAIYKYFNARIDALEKAMLIGDDRLADHIKQQVRDIRDALITAEQLELERVSGLRREITLAYESSEKAILKQEAANEKRFAGVNEWRGQSLDRERTVQETLAQLTGTFLPREVADKQLDAIELRISKLEKGEAGNLGRRLGVQASTGAIVTAIGLLGVILTIVVILANWLAV